MRSTGPSPAVRQQVAVRANWTCERCGCVPYASHIHHRKPRGLGGTSDPTITDPSLLVFLCSDCHQHIESNRTESYEQGWLIRRSA